MVITKLYGGLGNQMYQYAAGKALATKLKSKLILDTSWFEEIKGNPDVAQRVYELDGFNIYPERLTILDQAKLSLWPAHEFKEGGLNYNSDFEGLRGNVILDGYWQSYRYFEPYSEVIQSAFAFQPFTSTENEELLQQIEQSESVALHVRRGDYNTKRGRAFHGLLKPDYYHKALKLIQSKVNNPEIFVFSDEIDWCKKTFSFDFPAHFVDSNSTSSGIDDMHLMAACKHNIIANSSFSSWAAWLNTNKNKLVYAPRSWFVTVDAIKDRVPASWHLL